MDDDDDRHSLLEGLASAEQSLNDFSVRFPMLMRFISCANTSAWCRHIYGLGKDAFSYLNIDVR